MAKKKMVIQPISDEWYPGIFGFQTPYYSERPIRISEPPEEINGSHLLKAFTQSEVDAICTKISTTKTIPRLSFINKHLDEYFEMEGVPPFWVVPFVVFAERIGGMLMFNENGLFGRIGNEDNPIQGMYSNSIEDVDLDPGIDDGYTDDKLSLEFENNNTKTIRIFDNNGSWLSLNEFHGNNGSQLQIIMNIWRVFETVLQDSKGSTIWIWNDTITQKSFDSFDEIIDWANNSVPDTEKLGVNHKKSTKAKTLDTNKKKLTSDEGNSDRKASIELFLSKIVAEFPSFKPIKDKTYGHENIGRGCIFAINIYKDKIGIEFVSQGKLPPRKLMDIVNKFRITNKKMFKKYEIVGGPGHKNPTHIRVDGFIPIAQVEDLEKKDILNETLKMYNEFKKLFEKLPEMLGK